MNEEIVKHTPAPWTANIARRIGNVAGGFSVEEASTGHVICGRAGWPTRAQESEANARLIAAAPDLLAAVKDYLAWGPMTGSDRDLFEYKFREAIAKVEGGQ